MLRGLIKLVAVVVGAVTIGAGLGIGLAALSGDDELLEPATGTTATTTSPRAGTASVTAPPPTTTSTTTTSTTATATATATTTTAERDPLELVKVRVLGAILHPASSESGKQRQRARLTMRVRAQNTGTSEVTIQRPAITAGGETVPTDRLADAKNTNFGDLGAGETRAVTLRFETAGAVTAQLTNEQTGQLRIVGRTIDVKIRVGSPLRPSG